MEEEETFAIPKTEKGEYEEFKREKKLKAVHSELKKLCVDGTEYGLTMEALQKKRNEAEKYGLCGICVYPVHVKTCKRQLLQGIVRCRIPGGESTVKTKAYACKRAVADGADEIVFSVCASAVKSNNKPYLRKEIKRMKKSAKKRPVIARLQTNLYTQAEVYDYLRLANDCGLHAVLLADSANLHSEIFTRAKNVAPEVRLYAEAVNDAEAFRSLMLLGADGAQGSNCAFVAEALLSEI